MTAAGDIGHHDYTRERGEYRNLVAGPNGDSA
jgi:hypothetical protein